MTIKRVSNLACLNMGFHWFIVGIIIPVMTLFLIEKGFTLIQVGIAFAVYGGTVALLELPTGGLSDTIGRKKVYQISLIFQIIGSIALILANGFYGILVCFVFQGASRALSSGTMDAYFIDEFYKIDPDVNLQKQMSKIGVFIPIALGIGSLLGGYLPMTLGVLTKNTFLDSVYSSNYIALILAAIVQYLLTTILIKEEKIKGRDNTIMAGFKKIPEVIEISIKYGLKHQVILILLIAGFVWGFSISGLEQLWQPQVKSIISADTGTWIFGLLTCGYFIAAGLGNIIVNPICRIFKNNYVLVLFSSRLIMGILYFILAYQNGIIPFSIFYITLFMFNGVQNSPESALFNKEIPSDKRSTMLSFSSLFMQAGGITGSIINGYLAHTYSIKVAWIVASIIIMISAVLYLIIPLGKKRTSK
ncbi:MAG: MFS transporter [Spirochaetaceae bacterium]